MFMGKCRQPTATSSKARCEQNRGTWCGSLGNAHIGGQAQVNARSPTPPSSTPVTAGVRCGPGIGETGQARCDCKGTHLFCSEHGYCGNTDEYKMTTIAWKSAYDCDIGFERSPPPPEAQDLSGRCGPDAAHRRCNCKDSNLFCSQHGYCGICNKLLTVEESMERGVGPICAGKIGIPMISANRA